MKYLIPFLAILVAFSGFEFGKWILGRRSGLSSEDEQWIDEYQGLAPRTDRSDQLFLSIEPSSAVVRVGQPIVLKVRITNKGSKPLVLNSWLEPYPACFKSNQFPLKVSVVRDGQELACRGNAELRPFHTKKDFFDLKPGESREVRFDLTSRKRSFVWDFARPGNYRVSVWYESYLTGRPIGVRAFTGKSNTATVNILVER